LFARPEADLPLLVPPRTGPSSWILISHAPTNIATNAEKTRSDRDHHSTMNASKKVVALTCSVVIGCATSVSIGGAPAVASGGCASSAVPITINSNPGAEAPSRARGHRHLTGNHYVKTTIPVGSNRIYVWWADNNGGTVGTDRPDAYYTTTTC
jgi:hypothetical protein